MGYSNMIYAVKRWLGGTDPSVSDNITLSGDNTHSGTNSFSGTNTLSGTVKFTAAVSGKLVKLTTTSVLTSTTLTKATHCGHKVLITTGTSLSLARHRIKLPAAASGTSGDEYEIVSAITGTPTSNGIVVKPGTTTDFMRGTGTAGKGLKGSTRGIAGVSLRAISDGSGSYYVIKNSDAVGGAATSLVWRTT